MTFLTCDSSVPTSVAICATGIRVPDAQQINARSRLTSEAALRDNRLSRLPSSGSNSRTHTGGGRIHTSKSGMRPGSTPTSRFRSIDTRRSTSGLGAELAQLAVELVLHVDLGLAAGGGAGVARPEHLADLGVSLGDVDVGAALSGGPDLAVVADPAAADLVVDLAPYEQGPDRDH